MKTFRELGIQIPDILLPSEPELETWSVVACDQYTQDRDYWKQAEKCTAGKPSTLNLILPEVYLNDSDKPERIKKIRRTMNEYLDQNIFAPAKHAFICVERKTAYGRTRHGLIAAIDLETYEWKPFSNALIRATEATIQERIPPRMEIRRGAPIDIPHIMLLVNDPERILVEGTCRLVKDSGEKPVYSGNLMMNSGSITGWAAGTKAADHILEALNRIADANTDENGAAFLFAVGDGNHSLATAKTVWNEYREQLKKSGETDESLAENPVRYALVEIVNIYDEGLTFEPIHRAVFNAKPAEITGYFMEKFGTGLKDAANAEELETAVKNSKADFGFVYTENGKTVYKHLSTNLTDLAAASFQPAADSFIKEHESVSIDYIHGSAEIFRLGAQENTIGILLPPIAKDSFFSTINGRGPLPRKSFSMGEADEKRFYLECRRLFRG